MGYFCGRLDLDEGCGDVGAWVGAGQGEGGWGEEDGDGSGSEDEMVVSEYDCLYKCD